MNLFQQYLKIPKNNNQNIYLNSTKDLYIIFSGIYFIKIIITNNQIIKEIFYANN